MVCRSIQVYAWVCVVHADTRPTCIHLHIHSTINISMHYSSKSANPLFVSKVVHSPWATFNNLFFSTLHQVDQGIVFCRLSGLIYCLRLGYYKQERKKRERELYIYIYIYIYWATLDHYGSQ